MNPATFRDEFLAALQEMEDERPHVVHVARLAIQLFDIFHPLREMGVEDRLLLDAAALSVACAVERRPGDRHGAAKR